MGETIVKEWCPECGKPSFANLGNTDDCSLPDTDGMRCPYCGHVWFWDEEVALEEANIIEGKAKL